MRKLINAQIETNFARASAQRRRATQWELNHWRFGDGLTSDNSLLPEEMAVFSEDLLVSSFFLRISSGPLSA